MARKLAALEQLSRQVSAVLPFRRETVERVARPARAAKLMFWTKILFYVSNKF
jgi:hypothetical protein